MNQRLLKDNCESAFTLVELMIVVFVISVLASISLIYYGKYKERGQAKDLVTTARGCAAYVISECVMKRGEISNLSGHSFSGCENRTFENTGHVSMIITGCCTEFKIEAIGDKLSHYKGECTGDYRDKVECDIVKR